jgi:hypothetical protein
MSLPAEETEAATVDPATVRTLAGGASFAVALAASPWLLAEGVELFESTPAEK